MRRRTKIVATIGPFSESLDIIRQLIKEGVDIFRLNFSHGDEKSHEDALRKIRSVGKNIKIIADIPGPKLRIGEIPKEGIDLATGSEIVIETDNVTYKRRAIPITLEPKHIPEVGDKIFLDDGMISLGVEDIIKGRILCKVLHGGLLLPRKGVNVKSFKPTDIFSKNDVKKIEFVKKLEANFIALSFIRNAEDIEKARVLVNNKKIKLISKIETASAIRNLDEIIEVSDGIMVARGDLAFEVPLEKIPVYQKEIIKKCHNAKIPVIIATHMLHSMTKAPIPTRAEVSDIANAVFDSVDAVMLSNETASGHYPVESVRMMRRVIESVEAYQRTSKP